VATKTRRKEVETVRTYRSEEEPMNEPRTAPWERLWPWSRARARTSNADRIRAALHKLDPANLPELRAKDVSVPEVRVPDVRLRDLKLRDRLPSVRIPEVRLPEMNLPEVKLPDLRLQERISDANLPDMNLRDVKLPDLKLQERLADVRVPEVTLDDVRDAAQWPRRELQRRQRARQTAKWTARGITGAAIAVAAICGAAIAYFFDPERGKARRIQTGDQLAALARRTGAQATTVARSAAANLNAMGQRMARPREDYIAPNDAALKAKVESELFQDPSIAKGRLNINVENGVVVLRGTADSEDQIERIVTAVKAIAGVRSVSDLLRVPAQEPGDVMGTPNGTIGGETTDVSGDGETVPSAPGY
jgi:hypothetical protein